MSVPQVMISSTFFDLKQVRANLATFIADEIGCTPLVSEWASFPIDPNIDTVENCRQRVEHDADVLVLVIGGRYGYVDSATSKSVTNLEYLAARAKGIPVYVFVERRVLAALDIWRANKTADFSSVVDDLRVFSFIDDIRNLHKVWVQEFELAGEIVHGLRIQLAHLLQDGVRMVRRSRSDKEYRVLRELRGAPLRIALEKPVAWEHRLFGETLIQEVEAGLALAERKRIGITFGAYELVTLPELSSWALPRMAELNGLIKIFDDLINKELPRALGLSGEPKDVRLIVFCARSLGALYQEAIEWSLRVRRVVGDEIESFTRGIASLVDDIIEKIEQLGPYYLRTLDEMISSAQYERSIMLQLKLPGAEEVAAAFADLTRRLEEMR